ncbi:hypothetical protein HDV00_004038 [Rhizophlyctis rosea]|nr:hypothetical protein HDV00_004038 [Rhizophlyctis rosea]
MDKASRNSITKSDLAWAEAGSWYTRHGPKHCWERAEKRCLEGHQAEHIRILEAIVSEVEKDTLERTLNTAVVRNNVGLATVVAGGKVDIDLEGPLVTAVKKRRAELVNLIPTARPTVHALNSAFITGSIHGHPNVVHLLLGANADVTYNDNEALRKAVSEGKSGGTVKALLDAGADARWSNDELLCIAAENNSVKMAKLLMEAGARVEEDQHNALCMATLDGNTTFVNTLLKYNPPIKARNAALVIAATEGYLTIVKALSKVADVHYHNDEALVEAASHGHLECTKVLLWAGVEEYRASLVGKSVPSGVSGHVSAAMWLAKEGGHEEVVRFLLGFFAKNGVSYKRVEEYKEFYE